MPSSAVKTFSLRFDKQAGLITSYRYKGVDAAGARARARTSGARPPTTTAAPGRTSSRSARRTDKTLNIELWREAGPRWEVKDVKVDRIDDSTARVTVNAALPVGRRDVHA